MQNHYSRRAVAAVIISVLFTVLATIMVVLRIMGRRMKRVSLWLDDYAIIASLCFVYPLMILIVVSVTNLGDGRHIYDLPHDTLVLLLKDLLASQFAWSMSVALVKLGILLFYLRIFTMKRDRVATFIMMGVAVCWILSALLGAFFQCRPFSFTWNQNQEGNCNARVSFWVAIGISHIVTDVLILLLPVHMVWKLQVPLNTKIGLYILFGLGSLICIISGFRLHALDDVGRADLSFHLPTPHIWSILEPTVAICTACLPVARPVFLRALPSSLPSNPPTSNSFKPRSPDSYGSAEEAAAGPFQRLIEQEIPLKEMRNQVATANESAADLQTPPSKQAAETEL